MPEEQSWWLQVPWGAGSVILAVVAIGVSITLYLKTRKVKTLDYQFVDDVQILSDSVGRSAIDDVVVTVGGVVIGHPRIVTVRFTNTGNQEILRGDFLSNSITTSDESGVVNSQLVGLSDRRIEVTEAGVVPHKTYTADCLNAGDYIVVRYLLDMSLRTRIIRSRRSAGFKVPLDHQGGSESRSTWAQPSTESFSAEVRRILRLGL